MRNPLQQKLFREPLVLQTQPPKTLIQPLVWQTQPPQTLKNHWFYRPSHRNSQNCLRKFWMPFTCPFLTHTPYIPNFKPWRAWTFNPNTHTTIHESAKGIRIFWVRPSEILQGAVQGALRVATFLPPIVSSKGPVKIIGGADYSASRQKEQLFDIAL